MTDPVCADGWDCREFGDLRDIWSLLMDSELDMGSKLERVFARETEDTEFDYAFLSRIDMSTETQHIEVGHGTHDRLQAGESAPLSRTYCRRTVAHPDGTVRVSDASAEGWGDDRAYQAFGLGCYLGTTVELDDDVYGTLCFASSDPRDEPISDVEVTLLETLAEWVDYELHRWHGPPTRDLVSVRRDRLDVLVSPEIDEMMDALGQRPRRLILLDLLEGVSERRIDEFLEADGSDTAEVELRHVHLPKLADAGYVDWDRETDRMTTGPNFSRVAPLLRLIRDYTDEFGAD